MPIAFSCPCGRSLRVKDEAAGRKVRCPACGEIRAVPQPEVPRAAEDEALDILLTESPPKDRPRRPARAEPDERIQEGPRRPPPAPPLPRALPSRSPDVEDERPRPARKKKRRKRREGYSGIAINPEIIAGVGMMAGAALWFFLGLAAGYIYFYPPVLFVLGIGAIIRGFTGSE